MSQVRLATAAVMAATLLATACTPTPQPTPTPTTAPSPTFSCSTSTVSDPCTAEKAAKEKQQAGAIAASDASFRSFMDSYSSASRQGGSSTASPAMQAVAAGPFLKAYVGFLADLRKQHQRMTGSIKPGEFKFLPGEARTGSPSTELTFQYCVDGTGSKILNSSGKEVDSGIRVGGKMYVRPISGVYKLWDSDDKEVSSCA